MEKQYGSAGKTLQKYLRPGEVVRWQGRTEEFPLMEQDAKGQILGKWIGVLIAAAALCALCISSGRSSFAIAGILVASFILMIAPIWERRSVLKQLYCITDQRAILVTADRTAYDMSLTEIHDVRTVYGKTQYGCLVLGGGPFEEIQRQLRWCACHPRADACNGNRCSHAEGIVFFNIRSCAEAEKLLRGGSRERGCQAV